MLIIFSLLFSLLSFGQICGPTEVFIREQWINTYPKRDGTKVSSHPRSAHCREIERSNYFADSTKQTFANMNPKFRKWTAAEKKIVEENLAILPPWLSKYKLGETLRGDSGGHSLNPAASYAQTKALLIFDQFFKEKDKRAVIIHEMAHIALPSIDPDLKFEFGVASGWGLGKKNEPIPPSKLLLPDSQDSVNEDLTNYIEAYYVDPNRLMLFNPHAFTVVKRIIESKENEQ